MAISFFLLFVTLQPTAYAKDGQIKIGQPADGDSFPIVIDHAGSYVLTDNLVVGDPDANAIEIVVNDVTLDLNGHTIHGPATGGGFGNGIFAENRYSITILNGRVWGFGIGGVRLHTLSGDPSKTGAGHMVRNIQAMNNGTYGIFLSAGIVSDCVANSNGDAGIWATDAALIHCTANKNTGTAGMVFSNSSASNCTANGNAGLGIIVGSNSTIDNMTAFLNGSTGIKVSDSSVINCSSIENSGSGIWADGSRIENNLVSGNKNYGLYINTQNYVIKNSGAKNTPANISSIPANNYVPLPVDGDNANRFF
jgi:hypothetical protein